MIGLKRAYEQPSKEDGRRILVERLWPRGLTKERARIDRWAKEIAPSTELRKWYAHDVSRWAEFRSRYWRELEANSQAVERLEDELKQGQLTFVYAARDEEHNSARVLKEFIETKAVSGASRTKRANATTRRKR